MRRHKGFGEVFYVSPDAFSGSRVFIRGAEARHISVVLRRKPGEVIDVVDGHGAKYRIELVQCRASEVVGEILDSQRSERPRPELWVAAGLIRAPRMDELVERCTELGATAVVPLSTSRSLPAKGVSEQRILRWQRIAASAMTQSGRLFLPRVFAPAPVGSLRELAGETAAFILADPSGQDLLLVKARALTAGRLVACVGPEGGFAPEEVGALISFGATAVTLGRARLRTETAAAAIVDRLGLLAGRGRIVTMGS